MYSAFFDAKVSRWVGGVGGGCVAVRRGFSHAGEPIKGRCFRPFDQAVQRFDCLQFRHHFVNETIRASSRQIQHHALRLTNVEDSALKTPVVSTVAPLKVHLRMAVTLEVPFLRR